MKATPLLSNFTAGEFSALLDGRVDITKYYNAAKTLENFLPLPYGGIKRRPGTYYVAEVKDSSKATRLIKFQFSTTQAYILEFGNLYIRFYRNQGVIMSGVNPYEIVSPFLEAELSDLQLAQDADTMWIVHPNHKPQKLTRTAHDNWTIGNYTPASDVFTAADLYPSCVSFFEQRLVFANSNTHPQRVWMTKSGDYEDMTTGAGDDAAIIYTIGAEEVNAIRWISSGKVLVLGTLGGGFALSSGTEGSPVTPTNVTVKRETTYGSIAIVPKKIGNFVYYIQRNAKTVREFVFNSDILEYQALDMTLLAEHITRPSIVDMDYQQSPYNILWCVRSDGVLATLTRQIPQEVIAWSRQTTDGSFESVAVIAGDGGDDEVWFIVNRTVSGATRRYVEYLKPMDFGTEQEDAYFVDCGLTKDDPVVITNVTQTSPVVVTAAGHGLVNGDQVTIRNVVGMTEINGKKFTVAGVAGNDFNLNDSDGNNIDGTAYTAYVSGGESRKCVSTVGNLTHLIAKEVSLLVDGATSPAKTVDGAGQITLDATTGKGGEIHAGLKYISRLKTMRLEAGSELGTAQSKMKRIGKAVVRLYESLGCKIGDENVQDTIPFRSTSDDMDTCVPLYTGDKDVIFRGGYTKDAYVVALQEDPLPLIILCLILYMQTYET